jgi:hypothetical protein
MILIRFLRDLIVAIVGQGFGMVDHGAEIAVLRQQLAAYQRRDVRPDIKPQDRVLWVILSKLWKRSRSAVVFVTPATVIGWHSWTYRKLWGLRSRRRGRPVIDSHVPRESTLG